MCTMFQCDVLFKYNFACCFSVWFFSLWKQQHNVNRWTFGTSGKAKFSHKATKHIFVSFFNFRQHPIQIQVVFHSETFLLKPSKHSLAHKIHWTYTKAVGNSGPQCHRKAEEETAYSLKNVAATFLAIAHDDMTKIQWTNRIYPTLWSED